MCCTVVGRVAVASTRFVFRELANYPEGEQNEMIELYMSKGLSADDARTVIGLLSKHEEFFVGTGRVHQL